jgi:hypothetical protein
MADTLSEPTIDPQDAFIASIEAKYATEDRASVDAADGMSDDDEQDDQQDGTTEGTPDPKATAEHPAADTSAAPDGDAAESAEDSEEDDDTEHPPAKGDSVADDAAPKDGDDPANDAGEALTDDDLTDATKLLNSRGAELKLEDVPESYRPLVEKQIRNAKAAFTRVMQEATAFRSERAEFEAERAYLAQHPELAIVELLRKHPELFEKVNELETSIGDDAEAGTKFDQRVADTRKQLTDQARERLDAAQATFEQQYERATHIDRLGRDLAAKAGLPWHFGERAILAALGEKPADAQDLTDEEVSKIIAEEAKHLAPAVRKQTRDASKAAVQARTASRKAAPVSPAKKPPTASRPAVAAPTKTKVNPNDRDALEQAMMDSARRIIPGAR